MRAKGKKQLKTGLMVSLAVLASWGWDLKNRGGRGKISPQKWSANAGIKGERRRISTHGQTMNEDKEELELNSNQKGRRN